MSVGISIEEYTSLIDAYAENRWALRKVRDEIENSKEFSVYAESTTYPKEWPQGIQISRDTYELVWETLYKYINQEEAWS